MTDERVTPAKDTRRGNQKRCSHGHKKGCVPESWPDGLPLTDEFVAKGFCLWGLLHAIEHAAVESALTQCAQNKSKASQLLGINRTTLIQKMKGFGMPLGRANPRAKKFNPTDSVEDAPCSA
jgi:transcriptional regulator of acetoin/glycerol metabolism